MRRHEIHVQRRGETGGAYAVAFVLTVFIIGDNNNLTARKRSETFLNAIKFFFQNKSYFTIC